MTVSLKEREINIIDTLLGSSIAELPEDDELAKEMESIREKLGMAHTKYNLKKVTRQLNNNQLIAAEMRK